MKRSCNHFLNWIEFSRWIRVSNQQNRLRVKTGSKSRFASSMVQLSNSSFCNPNCQHYIYVYMPSIQAYIGSSRRRIRKNVPLYMYEYRSNQTFETFPKSRLHVRNTRNSNLLEQKNPSIVRVFFLPSPRKSFLPSKSRLFFSFDFLHRNHLRKP